MTARSLETLIRLSSAHAKARLSHKVEETDAVKAVELMNFALYHETSSPVEARDKDNGIDGRSQPNGDDDSYSSSGRYVSMHFRYNRGSNINASVLRTKQ